MPVYTYRCGNCGNEFEREQSYQDEPLKTCPKCKKRALKKVISPVGVVFKGSGFYATDHKSSSGSTSSRKPKSEDKSSAGEGSKSTASESTTNSTSTNSTSSSNSSSGE